MAGVFLKYEIHLHASVRKYTNKIHSDDASSKSTSIIIESQKNEFPDI